MAKSKKKKKAKKTTKRTTPPAPPKIEVPAGLPSHIEDAINKHTGGAGSEAKPKPSRPAYIIMKEDFDRLQSTIGLVHGHLIDSGHANMAKFLGESTNKLKAAPTVV